MARIFGRESCWHVVLIGFQILKWTTNGAPCLFLLLFQRYFCEPFDTVWYIGSWLSISQCKVQINRVFVESVTFCTLSAQKQWNTEQFLDVFSPLSHSRPINGCSHSTFMHIIIKHMWNSAQKTPLTGYGYHNDGIYVPFLLLFALCRSTSRPICFFPRSKCETSSFATLNWLQPIFARGLYWKMLLRWTLNTVICIRAICFPTDEINTNTTTTKTESRRQMSTKDSHASCHPKDIHAHIYDCIFQDFILPADFQPQ